MKKLTLAGIFILFFATVLQAQFKDNLRKTNEHFKPEDFKAQLSLEDGKLKVTYYNAPEVYIKFCVLYDSTTGFLKGGEAGKNKFYFDLSELKPGAYYLMGDLYYNESGESREYDFKTYFRITQLNRYGKRKILSWDCPNSIWAGKLKKQPKCLGGVDYGLGEDGESLVITLPDTQYTYTIILKDMFEKRAWKFIRQFRSSNINIYEMFINLQSENRQLTSLSYRPIREHILWDIFVWREGTDLYYNSLVWMDKKGDGRFLFSSVWDKFSH